MVRCCHAAMRRGHRSATKRAARRASRSLLVSQEQAGITALSCLRMGLKGGPSSAAGASHRPFRRAKRANGQLFAACGGLPGPALAWSACSGRSLAEPTFLAQIGRLHGVFCRPSPGVPFHLPGWKLSSLHRPFSSIYCTIGCSLVMLGGTSVLHDSENSSGLCGGRLGDCLCRADGRQRFSTLLPRCLARILSACHGQASLGDRFRYHRAPCGPLNRFV